MLVKTIKIVLSILLLGCLANMPYGYYQLVRFWGMFGFAILAYKSYEQEAIIEVIIYIALALLFQPLVKIALGRFIWNIIDVIVAIFLIASIFIKRTKTGRG